MTSPALTYSRARSTSVPKARSAGSKGSSESVPPRGHVAGRLRASALPHPSAPAPVPPVGEDHPPGHAGAEDRIASPHFAALDALQQEGVGLAVVDLPEGGERRLAVGEELPEHQRHQPPPGATEKRRKPFGGCSSICTLAAVTGKLTPNAA